MSLQEIAILDANEMEDLLFVRRDPSSSNLSQVHWLKSNPANTAIHTQFIGVGDHARVGDLNRDSHADVVITDGAPGIASNTWYENAADGDDEFANAHVVDTDLIDVAAIGVGDMNGMIVSILLQL